MFCEGLYRNDLLQQFLESWYNQKFLGTHCTFGDDRHLTNRMLSMGYATKYVLPHHSHVVLICNTIVISI